MSCGGQRVETELFLDLAPHRVVGRFVAFQESGDERVPGGRPGLVPREHDAAVVLDDGRDHRHRVVVVGEAARARSGPARASAAEGVSAPAQIGAERTAHQGGAERLAGQTLPPQEGLGRPCSGRFGPLRGLRGRRVNQPNHARLARRDPVPPRLGRQSGAGRGRHALPVDGLVEFALRVARGSTADRVAFHAGYVSVAGDPASIASKSSPSCGGWSSWPRPYRRPAAAGRTPAKLAEALGRIRAGSPCRRGSAFTRGTAIRRCRASTCTWPAHSTMQPALEVRRRTDRRTPRVPAPGDGPPIVGGAVVETTFAPPRARASTRSSSTWTTSTCSWPPSTSPACPDPPRAGALAISLAVMLYK